MIRPTLINTLTIALLLALPAARPAMAQGFCFCLPCAIGTHRSFGMPTEAMTPTVMRGVCTILTHNFPGNPPPVAGDVILILDPADGVMSLSRVIALPGQTVQISDGALIIDGIAAATSTLPDLIRQRRADATGAPPTCPAGTPPTATTCALPQMRETLPGGGVSYATLAARLADSAAMIVPDGQIATLPDNRIGAAVQIVAMTSMLGTLEVPAPFLPLP